MLVVDADEVPLDFHATYAAKRKRYRYVIQNARAAHPFLRSYAYEYHAALDESEMHEAGQVLVGTHDFRAFETQHPNTATSVRTVFELTVRPLFGMDSMELEPCESRRAPGGFNSRDAWASSFRSTS